MTCLDLISLNIVHYCTFLLKYVVYTYYILYEVQFDFALKYSVLIHSLYAERKVKKEKLKIKDIFLKVMINPIKIPRNLKYLINIYCTFIPVSNKLTGVV